MTTRVVVLGGTGYVGSNISRHLSMNGFEVLALGRHEIDFLREGSWETLVTYLGEGVHVVVASAIPRAKQDTLESCMRNVAMIGEIARGIEVGSSGKIVFFSAADVYGHPALNLCEDQAVFPQNLYGAYKLFAESLLNEMFRKRALVIFRLPGVFGGADDTESIVAKFAKKVARGEEVVLTNSGKTLRDFLPMSYLQNVILDILQGSARGTFNVSCGKPISMKHLVEVIGEVHGTPTACVLDTYRGERDFDFSFNCNALAGVLFREHGCDLKSEIKRLIQSG